ncbi:polymer-forming cytoskeletal protein [Methanolobus bombayensis]|uniref:polymer-forming cytoskeletal protein n=1 Tax=Methanolobus bombayensis TaxID=38023 RepID=UPI001AE48A7A|nr:polymer-forming cytoskeletal protein [Methanolobus bombayensis]MBP1909081.1 cytoskeletal protein CcmA (bactofilin family) [Methanolobus bombayensis]
MKMSLQALCRIMLLVTTFMLLSHTAAAYTTIDSGDTVVIDEVIDDDVIVAGGNVIIDGTINGDVIVAGGTVEVNGNIEEDLIVAAGDVEINGMIGDDLRVASGTVTINGEVLDDVIVFSGDTVLADTGSIGGDLSAASGEITILGEVAGNVEASGEEINIEGTIGGDADLNAEEINISPEASIAGNLEYISKTETKIEEGTVGNNVHYYEAEYHEDEGTVSSVLSGLISYLALVLIGLIGLAIWPEYLEKIAAKTPESPGKAFLTGLLVLIVALIVAFLLFVTVIGIPLGLILLIALVVMFYVARVFASLWIGRHLLDRMGKSSRTMNEMAFGLLVLVLVSSIPVIGSLVYMVATLIPIGNIYMTARN